MVATNFIELLFFVGIPGSVVFTMILSIWVNKSNSNLAIQARQPKVSRSWNDELDDDDRNHSLESEMKSYYELQNFDRRVGRD
jgi:hypothetical protein